MNDTTTLAPPAALKEWSFPVEGMTCASCVARVERSLAAVPGVSEVSVNLATEAATVHADMSVPIDALRAAVEKAGYAAGEPAGPGAGAADTAAAAAGAAARSSQEGRNVALAAALSLPLLLPMLG